MSAEKSPPSGISMGHVMVTKNAAVRLVNAVS